MATIVLHQWAISPFCGKVRKILAAKGLSFACVDYNGLLARKAARLSPVGKLPVLIHDDAVIQDSNQIADFLEWHYPEPALIPEGAEERARVHFWEDWADEALYWIEVALRFRDREAWRASVELLCQGRPAWERPLFAWITGSIYRRKLAAQGLGRQTYAEVVVQLMAHVDALEALLSRREWLVGAHRSIADIAVSAQLDEIVRTSPLKTEILARPTLAAWLNRNQVDEPEQGSPES